MFCQHKVYRTVFYFLLTSFDTIYLEMSHREKTAFHSLPSRKKCEHESTKYYKSVTKSSLHWVCRATKSKALNIFMSYFLFMTNKMTTTFPYAFLFILGEWNSFATKLHKLLLCAADMLLRLLFMFIVFYYYIKIVHYNNSLHQYVFVIIHE